MVCEHPVKAMMAIGYRNKETGARVLRFDLKSFVKDHYGSSHHHYDIYRELGDGKVYDRRWQLIELPCGKCTFCRMEKARSNALRCYHERQSYDLNQAWFCTFTFGDEASIDAVFDFAKNKRSRWSKMSKERLFQEARMRTYTLVKGDFSSFMKRLRENVRRKFRIRGIRFFCAGEYGDLFERPHYHAILYGFDFALAGLVYLKTDKFGNKVYRCPLIEGCWKFGYVEISRASYQSAAYTSRYVTKKITGALADSWYGDRTPEFHTASNRPGIGRCWFERHFSEVYPLNYVLYPKKDGSYVKGKVPAYYKNLYKQLYPEDADAIQTRNIEYFNEHYDRVRYSEAKKRVKVKADCLRLRMKRLIREYERSEYSGVNIDAIRRACFRHGIDFKVVTSVEKYIKKT